jgi:hypothetical protein
VLLLLFVDVSSVGASPSSTSLTSCELKVDEDVQVSRKAMEASTSKSSSAQYNGLRVAVLISGSGAFNLA